MQRREFIGLVGGATAYPLAARAQQGAMPVIGFLNPGSRGLILSQIEAFREGLKESSYVEGQNVAIEYRFADGQFDRLPELATELAQRQVSAIVVTSNPGALAAKQATARIPVIFAVGSDPVKLGLVSNLSRPDGNITGLYFLTTALHGKRLGLLREMVPEAATLAVLVNPHYSGSENQIRDAQEAADKIGVRLVVVRANTDTDFTGAFAALKQQGTGALMVCTSPFFNSRREQLVGLAARNAVPAIFEFREFVAAGGLMSYGTNLSNAYRQIGAYAGRILKGAKPADLPVVQSTRFEFVINLRTAKTLGLKVPPVLLASADEVIE
ncbi:ABC transporter substrate-binding protein [Bradyrhizobium sp.]|uniref:ABC transporter substrate-binding protein n=1 Tax=Bradyrhizobium sp. TaxID=376 RepID=UPI001DD7FF45|nr:ABC transporter substrate-binding protein [Bradyrhizobium sp.]MBI5321331.1 ABC transporter substrate-binding protein [Bradyrhizobium sp.]